MGANTNSMQAMGREGWICRIFRRPSRCSRHRRHDHTVYPYLWRKDESEGRTFEVLSVNVPIRVRVMVFSRKYSA